MITLCLNTYFHSLLINIDLYTLHSRLRHGKAAACVGGGQLCSSSGDRSGGIKPAQPSCATLYLAESRDLTPTVAAAT